MRITGKIFLPLQGAGKVKEGHLVNVKFENYPHMEYGMVRVEITNISLVPIALGENKGYILEVHFPNGLITNYGKDLAFGQQMQGTAEIITEDLRLLDRFLNPIRSLWKQ
jgi:HlyD family secretion protein